MFAGARIAIVFKRFAHIISFATKFAVIDPIDIGRTLFVRTGYRSFFLAGTGITPIDVRKRLADLVGLAVVCTLVDVCPTVAVPALVKFADHGAVIVADTVDITDRKI